VTGAFAMPYGGPVPKCGQGTLAREGYRRTEMKENIRVGRSLFGVVKSKRDESSRFS
jgi:hypothetical protein